MKTITVIGQGFTGAIMSIVCARAIKKKKTLYKVYGQSPPDKRKPVTFEVLKKFHKKLDLNDYDQLMYFTWMVIMTTSMLVKKLLKI